MDSPNRVCALIPAYDEADRIASTLLAVQSRKEVCSVVVIDDGSQDKTAEIARSAGAAEVISLPKNSGKGAALSAGYAKMRDSADIFLLLDADLGASATECVKLLWPIFDDRADMTVGLLPPDRALATDDGAEGGGMGLVVSLARYGLQKKTGLALAQPLSGQRAVRREVLESLGGKFSTGFGVEIGLTLGAARHGFKILEVETAFRHRVTGDDWRSILHRSRQFIDVAQALTQKT